jgi:hypothetical protein
MFRHVLLVGVSSRVSDLNKSYLRLSTRPAGNHSGSSSHQYSTPDVLDRLAWIRTIVKFDMSTIAGPSSPRLGKLEAGTVSGARVCPRRFSDRERGFARIFGLDDTLSRVEALQVVRLYGTCLAYGSSPP